MKAENKMREQSYKSHIFAAAMLFVMGNTVITLPFCKQENFLLVFLLSAVFCIAFILLTIPLFFSRGKKSRHFSGCAIIYYPVRKKEGLRMEPWKSMDVDDLIYQDEWVISQR